MKREDKIKLVTNISKFLTINKIPNLITQEGDDSSIVIRQSDVPDKGIPHIVMRHIVNTSNFVSFALEYIVYTESNEMGVEVIKFNFDVSETIDPFAKEEKK